MSGKAEAIVRAAGTVTYGDPAKAGGLTLVVYDGAGVERFRAPARVGVTPGGTGVVADRPCPEGFVAHSWQVLDDAGAVVATGGLGRAVEAGDTFGVAMPTGELR